MLVRAGLAALVLAGALSCRGPAPEPPASLVIAPPPAIPAPPPTPEASASSVAIDLVEVRRRRDAAGSLVISITRDGSIFVGDTPSATDDALRTAARAALARDPDVRVLIAADMNTRHGEVIHVIAVLKQAGLTKFAFAVDGQ